MTYIFVRKKGTTEKWVVGAGSSHDAEIMAANLRAALVAVNVHETLWIETIKFERGLKPGGWGFEGHTMSMSALALSERSGR